MPLNRTRRSGKFFDRVIGTGVEGTGIVDTGSGTEIGWNLIMVSLGFAHFPTIKRGFFITTSQTFE